MNGLTLAEEYYQTCFAPLLMNNFADVAPHIAVGLCGCGSECFGYDDDISRDHDFEPGFCVFLPSENVINRKTAFSLERAYLSMPKSFHGLSRQKVAPAGGARHGVIRFEDFLRDKIGRCDTALSIYEWLHLPEQSLAEVTNGKIFRDDNGFVTSARQTLAYFPEDIRRKKITGHLINLKQTGIYNYERTLSHGEVDASQTVIFEFVSSAMSLCFLINKRYRPYYKWAFRALRDLPKFGEFADSFSFLITTDNTPQNATLKKQIIADLTQHITCEIHSTICGESTPCDAENLAFKVNASVEDSALRNADYLSAL